MRKNSLLLILLLVPFIANAQVTRVLFIGNSYTYVNDLPALVHDLALANGDTIIFDSYTPGGYTFQGHSTDANTIAKIYSQQWDFVILQEQSQRPSFSPGQVAAEVYPFAAVLDSIIHDNNLCTETVFYMTWGRKNGDASNCGFYPPVCTYDGMQARLRESYIELGLLNAATVSPVGAAWSYMRSLNPSFDLYQPDESHPSIYGSYLAACTFYATMFHKSPVGNTFISSLPQTDATAIQNAVHAVAIDSISLWYQHGNIPMAMYSYTANGNGFQFVNHSLNATTYNWDFGDGNISATASPFHNYSQPGTYAVTLDVGTGCKTDVITHQVTTGVTSVSEIADACSFIFNSSENKLIFNCLQKIKEVQLFDLSGRKVAGEFVNSGSSGSTYQFGELPAGIYLVQVTGDGFRWSEKLIRN